jgi:hypothetical protein
MRSSGRITLALALALSETANGQTVEEARHQMLMHTGQSESPAGQSKPLPTLPPSSLLLDPATQERDFQEGRRVRNMGIGLTVVGSALVSLAFFLLFRGVGQDLGDQIFCSPPCPSDKAGTYYSYAFITGIFGAAALGAGIPSWVAGHRRMRKARSHFVSIVPSVGDGFAGVGATFAF